MLRLGKNREKAKSTKRNAVRPKGGPPVRGAHIRSELPVLFAASLSSIIVSWACTNTDMLPVSGQKNPGGCCGDRL